MKKPTRPTVQYGQTEPFPLLTEIAEEYLAQMSTADQHQQQKQGEGNQPLPHQLEQQPRGSTTETTQVAEEQQQKCQRDYPQPGAPPERTPGPQHSVPQHVAQEEQHEEEKLQKAEL